VFWRPVGLKFDKKLHLILHLSDDQVCQIQIYPSALWFQASHGESQRAKTLHFVVFWRPVWLKFDKKNFNWVSIWVMIKCAKITSTPLHFDFRLHMKSHRENTEPRNPAICNVLTTSWVETWRKSFNRVSFWVMIKCAKIKSVPLHFVFRLLMESHRESAEPTKHL